MRFGTICVKISSDTTSAIAPAQEVRVFGDNQTDEGDGSDGLRGDLTPALFFRDGGDQRHRKEHHHHRAVELVVAEQTGLHLIDLRGLRVDRKIDEAEERNDGGDGDQRVLKLDQMLGAPHMVRQRKVKQDSRNHAHQVYAAHQPVRRRNQE